PDRPVGPAQVAGSGPGRRPGRASVAAAPPPPGRNGRQAAVTLNYVTVILNGVDGSGAPASRGWATIAPSAVLTDATNNLEVIPPVTAQFTAAASPAVRLAATDNATLQPPGWAWTITFQTVPGSPASYSFALPAGPQTFTATNAAPCVFTGSGAGYLNNTA